MHWCCAVSTYANAYKKSEESADNMRTQLTDYLEDATLARIELDETKRENERLKRRLEMLAVLRTVRPSCKERRE